MKQLGANVVRVHLQFAKFMDAPDRPNENSLERLGRLVKLAEETGLYLDLTGLGCYRKQDVPAWYNVPGRGRTLGSPGAVLGGNRRRCAASPAIFCYDLMNEPIVPGGKRTPGDWLTGELGGFNYCQFISLDQAGRPRPEIARRWVAQLAARHPQARPAAPDHSRPAAQQPGNPGECVRLRPPQGRQATSISSACTSIPRPAT